MTNVDQLSSLLGKLEQRAQAREQEGAAAAARLRRAAGTAENAMGRYSVDPSGRLVELTLSPAAATSNPTGLAGAILGGYNEALDRVRPLPSPAGDHPLVEEPDPTFTPPVPGSDEDRVRTANLRAAARAEVVAEQVQDARVVGSAGGVQVEVNGGGFLVSLRLDQGIFLQGAEAIETGVLAALAQAQDANRQAIAEQIGSES
ncbi:YbaB/EbfC family nucleoid-associated protein [Parenemella sanctibonifatiensis]|uniref:YbaB/EbfC family DNA-binding protein n=1 Tax=Parenemella sanctibonifatiensis TaxID=2016505 RepID=A0A255EHG3_9ACTN|nr:YbaB/EbfC family nucleoid-associated protein [Parenemella sanctibonifatiensis]OYN88852.1 hypothetical protein CGZ92_03870 [Parenemella sanctibonifatiensis]